ncbi:unnamed protein product [Acanthocheilonema viteae]|uniref:Uncharacterized protein n=1 Tax=Acanthocheilonema viteae TaxID=6277 RepID=A0A498SQ41_ACAVI|nr:unnamed protein product [Acanthocheilonema viteae]
MFLQVVLFLAALVFLYYGIRNFLESIQITDLNTKAVFISGCDSGFGYLLAIKCAQNGLSTFAGCLTEHGMKTIEEMAQKTTGRLIPVQIDVTNEESVQNAVRFVQENLNSKLKFWALVNNAGSLGVHGYDDWCTVEDYAKDLNVNTLGVIRVTHAFMPLLKQSRGRVVAITSVCGRLALPGIGPYTVSKFATEAYINILRQEVREFGIHCAILEPGRFQTSLMDKKALIDRINRAWNRLDNTRKAEYGGEAFKELYIALLIRSSNSSTLIMSETFVVTKAWGFPHFNIMKTPLLTQLSHAGNRTRAAWAKATRPYGIHIADIKK